MLTSHILLLKYRHDPRYDFGRVTIWYLDRGAPGDRSSAQGAGISAITDQYLEIATPKGTKYIPFHRLRKIDYDGVPVWDRSGLREDPPG
jgi:hypothetical protein